MQCMQPRVNACARSPRPQSRTCEVARSGCPQSMVNDWEGGKGGGQVGGGRWSGQLLIRGNGQASCVTAIYWLLGCMD